MSGGVTIWHGGLPGHGKQYGGGRTALNGARLAPTTTIAEIHKGRLVKPGTLDEVDAAVLGAYITQLICPFCDAGPFKSLSGHFAHGHHFGPQEFQAIRDAMQVPKRFSMISEGTRAKYSEHGKAIYDPRRLRQKGNKRQLSAFGVAVNRKKLAKLFADPAAARAQRQQAGRIAGEREHQKYLAKDRRCVICNGPLPPKHKSVCSWACRSVRLSATTQANIKAGRMRNSFKQTKPCLWCGLEFTGRRRTCSDDCFHKLLSDQAKQRPSNLAKANTARRAILANRPPRLCDVDGCGREHLVHGLCSMHAQRTKKASKAN